MISKKYRLPASFFRKRNIPVRTISLPFFLARVYASSLPYSRFACVAPNNVFASVVKRNAFRRAAYEAIRLGKLFEVPGYDVVIAVGKKHTLATREEFAEGMREVRKAMKK